MPRARPQPTFLSSPVPHWQCRGNGVAATFSGRTGGSRDQPREAVLRLFDAAPQSLAWAKQVHSATVLRAVAGCCGEGDALWTETPGVALSIVTADCVPIVCGGGGTLAAIHAGWRGLAAGAIEATLAQLPARAGDLDAWLGPAIGPCCYEVGPEVAQRVIERSEAKVAVPGRAGKVQLDLHHAAQVQLRELGVERVHRIEACTRCSADILWSYRGCSGANGRNVTLAWLTEP